MKIMIGAGGTGGHLFPGVAIAKELRKRGHRVHFIVKKDRDSQPFLAREGFPSSSFWFEGFPRKLSWRTIGYPFIAGAAFLSARRIFRREAADVFLGMGGYISVPAGLAAVRGGVPLVLHEQNVRAGLANRFLSRWAKTVATSFESTVGLSPRANRTVLTGLPLRPDLTPKDPSESRRALGLDPDAFTLLIFGGSQGARVLNARVLDALKVLAIQKPHWQFIHLTGVADEEKVRSATRDMPSRFFVRAFHSDMATLYSAADFVVARAGANTVMEIRRMGRSALLVPYPFATDDHQTYNARILEPSGQARVIQEKDFSVEAFLGVLNDLPALGVVRSANQERLARVGQDLLRAAERVASLVEEK
jgi:UDP-N-acetylglucosamine--N-acetylmuramyl-(pentapeptide) pyrophosphoryl-undecaprenol N-acetylglucosamine transferase